MLLISCVTRRYYLKEDVNQILSAYSDFCVAPGGYMNGELIRIDGKTQATNMTLISVCFREGEAPLVAATRKPHAPVVSTIQRLATFEKNSQRRRNSFPSLPATTASPVSSIVARSRKCSAATIKIPVREGSTSPRS